GASKEAVVASFAVAAVLAGAHVAEVPPRAAPAAVASPAGVAGVCAGTADAVAVLRAGDTGVVAGAADAAVASRALRIAGVALAVADELVRARPEVGDHRDREAVGDVDEVPRG